MKKKVLVVTHDAGGSEIIAAYVKKHSLKKDFYVYTAGPGARVFHREGLPFKRAPFTREKLANLIKKHGDAELVLLGTGWMTQIESITLEEAKLSALKTAVYLESWSGYRERFGYPKKGWQRNLPDEIWVGDRYAEVIAKKDFPQTRIRYVGNEYFKAITARYRTLRSKTRKKNTVLFLSNAAPKEEGVFRELCEVALLQKEIPTLRIRFHPADNRARYDEIIKKYKKSMVIEKSKEKDIVHDLLTAKMVVGTETVAMAAAVLAGIRTISILNSKRKTQLPFVEIIKMKSVSSVFDKLTQGSKGL